MDEAEKLPLSLALQSRDEIMKCMRPQPMAGDKNAAN
jgi:hypothetical protein